MSKVRESCRRVMEKAEFVTIDMEALGKFAETPYREPSPWGSFDCHYSGDKVLDYIFALDSLNFCFWPHPSYDYPDLALNLKKILLSNPDGLSPNAISSFTIENMTEIFPSDFPNLPLRLEKIRELGQVTLSLFNGSYTNLLSACENSALKLVDLIYAHYPGFRDVSQYKGQDVFLMKRAQIATSDIYGAGAWNFHDINELTMFPDYQVPQVLNSKGVLKYHNGLQEKIDRKEIIDQNSDMEIEIRAATVVACDHLARIYSQPVIKIDWLLWQIGEEEKRLSLLKNHHRTITTFY